MFAKINCAGLSGIEGYPVEVESNTTNGVPAYAIVGDLSPETREAEIRVWNAMKSSGFDPDPRKTTVNLSPADTKKDGTAYDLAIGISTLASYGMIRLEKLKKTAFFGELSLSGELKPVRGMLPLCFCVRKQGIDTVVVPFVNAAEASLVPGLTVYGCRSLSEAFRIAEGDESMMSDCLYDPGMQETPGNETADPGIDFSDVRGQEYLKRAAMIAVCGRHNILFSGPAGTGKTMIARRMPTIMPELSRDEDIEISKIYSICGLLHNGKPLLSARPFRAPHHGISQAAFAGGGTNVLPGEMSLASSGILFLDELPLFPRAVLETMRQPMEERLITVSRVKGSFTYPADFQLVAAMNNCACGFYPDRKKCTCSPAQIKAYNGRLSKPLLERIDICAEARPLSFEEFSKKPREQGPLPTSAEIRKKVELVYAVQAERFREEKSILFNSRMGVREIEKYCRLRPAEESFMKEVFERKELSGRTYHKILKVARTIADMEGLPEIEKEQLSEAVELRSIEDKLFARGRKEISYAK